MIMATVTLAAIKIGGVLLGVGKYEVVLSGRRRDRSLLGHLGPLGRGRDGPPALRHRHGRIDRGGLLRPDPARGGRAHGALHHPELQGKLSFLPDFTDWSTAAAVFIVPVAVQWWSTWYPGAEPGGGGYVAQRMLAARNEKEAMGATLWFNVAHYALRPWPWILVALASLLVYPSLESIQAAFPNLDPVHHPTRPGLPGHAGVPAPRPSGPGGGLAGGCLHVHHQHPSELGRVLRGGRFLPSLHQRPARRTSTTCRWGG